MPKKVNRHRFPKIPATDFLSARENILAGDIVLTHKKTWLSRLTGKGMDSIWTHVGMVVKLPEIDRLMVIEGSVGGVRMVPLRHYVHHHSGRAGKRYPGSVVVLRSKLRLDPALDMKVLRNALDKLGAPYDWLEIFRIIHRWLLKILHLRYKRGYIADSRYICSEFTRDMLADYEIELPLNDTDTIVPGDFADPARFELVHVIQRFEQPAPQMTT